MKTIPFPPVMLGVDMLSNETSLPSGAVRQAINVNLDRAGNFSRREGYSRLSSTPCHSVKFLPQKGLVLLAQGNSLKVLDTTAYTVSTLYTLNSPDLVDYYEHNGDVYFSNRTTAGFIPYGSNTARQLGVPTPTTIPILSASSVGALAAGDYTVAIAYVDDIGQESGVGDYISITLASAGGISVSNLPTHSGWKLRVYMSACNGTELRLNSEFSAVTSVTSITSFKEGKVAQTSSLDQMVPGDFIRGFNGRLFTAVDNTFTFSDPLRYGLTHRSNNVVQMNGVITIFEPVLGGIFVGAGTKVWFLEGGDPSKFAQKLVSNCRAIPYSSTLVPGEHFNPKVVNAIYPVAVWLSTSGYVVGQADGTVVELQPDRVRIPGNQVGKSTFLLKNGMKQVITAVNSTSAVAFGTANDSTTS